MSIERIAPSELRLGMFIHKLGGHWLQHPFWRGSFVLASQQDLELIHQSDIPDVWIDTGKGLAPGKHARLTQDWRLSDRHSSDTPSSPAHFHLSAPVVSEPAPMPGSTPLAVEIARARQICQMAKEQIMQMFHEARLGKAISPEVTMPLVREVADSVRRHPQALISVARLKTRDDYTYLHSMAVCALMVSLAQQMKLSEEQTLLAGTGGLMHDLGKAQIPLEILNKPGKLTDQEFEIMKGHPTIGADLLQRGGAEPDVGTVALHHHEKMDGTGYPSQMPGDQIPLLARMGAVCDVYDAVTSVRPYKDPWSPAQAMHNMAQWGGHFDPGIFGNFVKAIGIYPIGSLVRLRSHRLAMVVEANEGSLTKPKVRVFYSLISNARIRTQDVDLDAPNCDDAIEAPEDPARLNFTGLDDLWLT